MRIGEAEPVYQGRPLGEWVRWTEDQEIDGSPSVAAANAAAAIKAIGPAKVIPFLLRWMNSPKSDSVIGGGAVKCFQILGPEAKSAIPELAEMLNQPVKTIDEGSRARLAAEALSYLGPDAVPILIAAANKERRGKWAVISLIANFAFAGRDAIPDVLNWSKSSDGYVRLGALHAYIGIEENKEALITFLLSALRDTEWSVRRDAARSLGDVAKGRTEVLAALFEALRDPDPQSVAGAILA